MENIVIIAVLVIILGLAVFYVMHAKKNGKKCIGCSVKCNSENSNCDGNCSACIDKSK